MPRQPSAVRPALFLFLVPATRMENPRRTWKRQPTGSSSNGRLRRSAVSRRCKRHTPRISSICPRDLHSTCQALVLKQRQALFHSYITVASHPLCTCFALTLHLLCTRFAYALHLQSKDNTFPCLLSTFQDFPSKEMEKYGT